MSNLRALRLAAYASPFLFPFFLLRFKVAGVPFTALEAFTYILFAGWLWEMAKDKRLVRWDTRTKLYWTLGLFLLAGATVGVLVSPHQILLPSGEWLDAQRVALGVWKGWLLAPILYFVVLTQALEGTKCTERLLRNFIYSAVLVSLAAYVLAFFGPGLTYDYRLSGFYESANYLALYLVPALLINLVFLLKRSGQPKMEQKYDAMTLAVLAHALFLTKSYAGILAVFGGVGLLALYAIFTSKTLRKYGMAGIGILLAAVLVFVITQWNTPKFQQFLDFENRSSTSVRLEVYEMSWKIGLRYPMAGHGLGLFQARYQTDGRELLGRPPMEWNIPHPHNIFLAFWLNTGIVGLLAFIGLLIIAHKPITYPLIGLWGIILHGMFDVPFWKNDLAMIFWLILAAIYINQYAAFSPKKPAPQIRRAPAARAKAGTAKGKGKTAKRGRTRTR